MSLIKKQPAYETSIPPYTIELPEGINDSTGNGTFIVVGLGNNGDKYSETRHNIGFKAVNYFAERNDFPSWTTKKNLKSEISENKINGNKIILIKPTTFMNNSGEAVQLVKRFYKLENENILIVHDDVDIDFGQIRMRTDGKSAGHNGIRSVISSLNNEYFSRVRIGVGPKKPAQIPSEDFVLKNFSSAQQSEQKSLLQETSSILSEYAFSNGKLTVETRSFII